MRERIKQAKVVVRACVVGASTEAGKVDGIVVTPGEVPVSQPYRKPHLSDVKMIVNSMLG